MSSAGQRQQNRARMFSTVVVAVRVPLPGGRMILDGEVRCAQQSPQQPLRMRRPRRAACTYVQP